MSVKWFGKDVEKDIQEQAVEMLWKIGFQVEEGAKRLCPVDTGRLRASITTSVDEPKLVCTVKSGGEVDEQQVTTARGKAMSGTNVEYAAYIELGTSKMSAQPFLRPALERVRVKR